MVSICCSQVWELTQVTNHADALLDHFALPEMRNSPEVLRRRTAQAEAEVERIRAETEAPVRIYAPGVLEA